jgi:hypothetical protein
MITQGKKTSTPKYLPLKKRKKNKQTNKQTKNKQTKLNKS